MQVRGYVIQPGANLRGADLQGADLWGANLRHANLRGADLRGANLRAAKLRDADLRDADLRGAELQGVTWPGRWCLTGTRIDSATAWMLVLSGQLTPEQVAEMEVCDAS